MPCIGQVLDIKAHQLFRIVVKRVRFAPCAQTMARSWLDHGLAMQTRCEFVLRSRFDEPVRPWGR